MARTAEDLVTVKLPKDLPAGVETIQSERTVGEGSGKERTTLKTVVSFDVPAENGAEGVKNFISHLSALATAAGVTDSDDNPIEDYGVRFAAGALRSAVVSALSAKLTPANHAASRTFLPPIPTVRTIDPFEAATAEIARRRSESGKMPTPKEIAEIYANYGVA